MILSFHDFVFSVATLLRCATWNSLFIAPRFQEYMSNHAVLTSSIMHVLSVLLGDEHTFTLEAAAYPNHRLALSVFDSQYEQDWFWGAWRSG